MRRWHEGLFRNLELDYKMILTQDDIKQLAKLASKAAKEAGIIVEGHAKNHRRLKNKKGGEGLASQVLTEADLKSQEKIVHILQESIDQYDLGWLGEESLDDKSRFAKDYFWCVDPLDGTLPYIEDFAGYAVSIALISKYGVPVLGVVYLPFSGKLFTSFDNDYQMNESSGLHLFCDRSFLETPYFEFVVENLKEYAFQNKISNFQLYSQAGAVVNSIGVLQHQNAVYFKFPKNKEGGGSIWDYAATECIFRNAKRPVSDIYGQPLDLNRKDSAFMNHKGILYASNTDLAKFIISMYQEMGE